jgi:hypothetical protein
MHPINVNNFEVEFQPKPLTGMAAKRVVDELISLSAQRQTVVASETDTAVLQLPAAVSSR